MSIRALDDLTLEERNVLRKVLLSTQLQLLIGGEEWDLTEDEEIILWQIIRRAEAQ